MKISTDRILTTHTGSLPRPKSLIEMVLGREKGQTIEAGAFEAETARAVDEIVAQQVAAGVDIVSDGEMSKPSYTTYIRHRVAGIAMDPRAAEKGRDIMIGRDLLDHPDFADRRRNFSDTPFPGCVAPLRYQDRNGLDRDIAHLKAAAGKATPVDVFMTAPSPGILTRFIINLHYPTEDAYVAALADVISTEYKAIVEAGFVLQIDAPDLGSARNNQYRHLSDDQFRKIAERNVAALNAATAGLPPDRMRLHICWGNYEGPHTHDLPLTKIIDIALKARPPGDQHRGGESAPRPRVGGVGRDRHPGRQDPDPGCHQFDHEFRRASAPGGATYRPLRRDRRPRARDRRRRLRFRHLGAHRSDRGRQHRLGETARAQRRRRDREQAAVAVGSQRNARQALRFPLLASFCRSRQIARARRSHRLLLVGAPLVGARGSHSAERACGHPGDHKGRPCIPAQRSDAIAFSLVGLVSPIRRTPTARRRGVGMTPVSGAAFASCGQAATEALDG